MLGSWQQPVGDELLWQCFNAPSAVDILRITPYGSCLRVRAGLGESVKAGPIEYTFYSPPTLLPIILTCICGNVPPARDPTLGARAQGVSRLREADWKDVVVEGDG